jgi:hypothetical protein
MQKMAWFGAENAIALERARLFAFRKLFWIRPEPGRVLWLVCVIPERWNPPLCAKGHDLMI